MTFFIFFMLIALTYMCISMYFRIEVIQEMHATTSKLMLFKSELDAAVSRLENRIIFLERAADWDSKWLAKNFQHPTASDVPAYRIYTPLDKVDNSQTTQPADLDAFAIPDGICLGSISHPESTAECPEDINSESVETVEMEFLDEFKVGDKVWIKEGATVWNDFSYHKWPIKEEYLGMALDLVAEAGSGRVKLHASTNGGMGSLVVFAFKKDLIMANTGETSDVQSI